MGCAYHLSCITCRKSYDLGYGSYGSWVKAETVEEYQQRVTPGKANLLKNKNLLMCLTEHKDHVFNVWSPDWTSERDGDLYISFIDYVGDTPIVPDYKSFEKIDLMPD